MSPLKNSHVHTKNLMFLVFSSHKVVVEVTSPNTPSQIGLHSPSHYMVMSMNSCLGQPMPPQSMCDMSAPLTMDRPFEHNLGPSGIKPNHLAYLRGPSGVPSDHPTYHTQIGTMHTTHSHVLHHSDTTLLHLRRTKAEALSCLEPNIF